MKKSNLFLKTIPMKLYVLLAGLLIVAFFSNDFGLVDIQKTAVILAVGVDGNEDGFSVTSEIAVPKGSERTTGGTSSVIITSEGKTVADCISQLYTKTGWVPKLVFCNLILIGDETAKKDALPALDYFLRNEYVNANCHLAVCEGRAEQTLSTQSAIDDTSSLAIEKLFSFAAEKAGRVKISTLREFTIGAYGKSASGFTPYIRTSAQEGQEQDAKTSSSSQNKGQENRSKPEKKIYQGAETALFADGKMVATLTEEETFALNLLKGNVQSGTLVSEEDGNPVTLTVLKNDGNVSLSMKGAPKATSKITLRVRIFDRGASAPVNDLTRSKPSEKALSFAKNTVERAINSVWNKAKEANCDLFELKTQLYRSSKKKFEEWESTLLSVVSLDLTVEIKPIE